MSNINTLDSLKNRAAEASGSSSDDEGQQAFYAGGGERSGQQVLGPPGKKKNSDQLVADMFKAARSAGAQVLDEHEHESKGESSSKRSFTGVAYSLGAGETIGTRSQSSTGEQVKKFRKLKMWRDGFSIDDGPLRRYNDPANAEFLECIRRGEVPYELVTAARGSEVELNMEDHRTEEYVQPKRKLETFVGEGHRLGNLTSSDQAEAPLANDDASDPKQNQQTANEQLKLDESQPTTNIQIRLSDGSKITVKVNLTHTVGDIRTYICNLRPVYAATPFLLMTTFPNTQLADEKQTVEAAKLKNAVIVQRLE